MTSAADEAGTPDKATPLMETGDMPGRAGRQAEAEAEAGESARSFLELVAATGDGPSETAEAPARPEAGKTFDARYGMQSGRPIIGSVFPVRSRITPDKTRCAAPEDFDRGRPRKTSWIPVGHALPYCWNFEGRRLLLTIHPEVAAILREPFLYGAQRKHAKVAAAIAMPHLDSLFGAHDPAASPIFVLSPGRTGSTLFNALLGCVTSHAISEPDTLTQLAAARAAQLSEIGIAGLHRLVWHSVSPFFHLPVEGNAGGDLAIKLRSNVNGLVPDILGAFPNARYVLMLRDRLSWARSVFRVFRLTPVQAVARLRLTLRMFAAVRAQNVRFTIVHYEEILANPKLVLSRIADRPLKDGTEAAINEIMKRDSQSGSQVSRDHVGRGREEEAAWMQAFEAEWTRLRPAEAIEALDISL